MKTLTLVANEPYHAISGGIPRFLQEIAPRLSNYFKVNVAVIGSSTQLEIERLNDNLTLYHFPFYNIPIGDSHPPRFLRKEIKELISKSDVVFVQTIDCFVPLYYAWKLKKTLLLYFHGIDWETFPRALGMPWLAKLLVPVVKAYAKFCYNKLSCLLVPSEKFIPLLQTMGVKCNMELLPLGVDTNRFVPTSQEEKYKQRKNLGVQDNELLLGYTGRLAREKNISFLLSVFQKLSAQNFRIKLLLVGSGVSDFDELIKNNSNIIAVGQQNDVVPYLHAMDIFVMPSTTETSSLSTLEAMACGLPSVAFDVGCISDYVSSGENSVLLPIGETEEFVSQISQLLQSESLRQSMGVQASKSIQFRMSWNACAKKLAQIVGVL